MTDLLERADRLWKGEIEMAKVSPMNHSGEIAEVAGRTAFVPSFGNVSAFATDEGLVLIDTGSRFFAADVHRLVRGYSSRPLNTAVFTHGHVDHVFGLEPFDSEPGPRPRVVAHEKVVDRFQRYLKTAGYNGVINQRQFQLPNFQWPVDYRYPDEVFGDARVLDIGGERFELNHGRGETDDACWAWVPSRKVLCCGDFFIWASPNAGNPQKVQRYAGDWAVQLRRMAGLGAEILLPGHGLPIAGADRIRQSLTAAAELLESLEEQTLAMMNQGARLDAVIQSVKAPAHLLELPYLQAVYDEPEFVVRNIWRLYGGWWDLNPATLKPAPEAALAAELATLAGGAEALARRARELSESGEHRLAGHLAELASLAAPGDREIETARSEVFAVRAEAEKSTMSRGVFSWAAAESRTRLEGGSKDAG